LPSREPDLLCEEHIICCMLLHMSEPAKKLVTFPADLLAEIKARAEKEGVSANAYIVAVLAAATGYRLPKEDIERYLRNATRARSKKQ
jgi:Pyruvate/2-oxoacid:ferredoxin oxidoreductase gamma subunit